MTNYKMYSYLQIISVILPTYAFILLHKNTINLKLLLKVYYI